jgi:hypothetical protein
MRLLLVVLWIIPYLMGVSPSTMFLLSACVLAVMFVGKSAIDHLDVETDTINSLSQGVGLCFVLSVLVWATSIPSAV